MKQDLTRIEQFLDALWLEKNLAENTLNAYRRDLSMMVIFQSVYETTFPIAA